MLTGVVMNSNKVAAEPADRLPVAAVVTEYRHNSHADIIVSRMLLTDTMDGKGKDPGLKLASLYTDQLPKNDTSRILAAALKFPIFPTIAESITMGTDKIPVAGVLLIGEHGDYPKSDTGSKQYPKMRFWRETVDVFKKTGQKVPVFMDKHISDNTQEAFAIYNEAKQLGIPIMAGSSVPGTWRHPAADVKRGAKLDEIVVISFGATDAYGYHALETAQALAEQRSGGETGIKAAQCLTGDAVWEAMDKGVVDKATFDMAWQRLPRRLNGNRSLKEAVPEPVLFIMEYNDGLKLSVIELNGAAAEWSGGWKYADGTIEGCQFWTQEARPGYHFQILLDAIEQFIRTGVSPWPVERTLMSSAMLDAALQSRKQGGKRIETPEMAKVKYQATWQWQQPPAPPEGRPWSEQ
jgi:hypothetical protein